MNPEFVYMIYLTGLCKDIFGTELGGGHKKDTHGCLLTRVADSLLGGPEMF
jgi:hypothetical protein